METPKNNEYWQIRHGKNKEIVQYIKVMYRLGEQEVTSDWQNECYNVTDGKLTFVIDGKFFTQKRTKLVFLLKLVFFLRLYF